MNLEALQALFLIGLEPAAHRGAMGSSILGDGLALPAPTRHQHRLALVTELSIGGGCEQEFQLRLIRCREA